MTFSLHSFSLQIVWIINFGSDEDSIISKSVNSWAINKKEVNVAGVPGGPISLGPVQEQFNTVVVSPNADYAYKAKALYDCKFFFCFFWKVLIRR